jgi:hypothetical protein
MSFNVAPKSDISLGVSNQTWRYYETIVEAQQLPVLLYNGLYEQANFAPAWRKLPPPHLQAASASA